jgi:hypothetical protein
MHIVKALSLRALVASVGVAAILSGCGTPARPAGDRGPLLVSSSPSPDKPAAKPSPHGGEGTPAGGYADPLDRYAYREAFGRCQGLGVQAVADAYGASASDPVSAATAYAQNSYPRQIHLREAATQGCLDGFSHRT